MISYFLKLSYSLIFSPFFSLILIFSYSLFYSLILLFSLLFLYSLIPLFSLLCSSLIPSLILSFSYSLIIHYHYLLFSFLMHGWREREEELRERKEVGEVQYNMFSCWLRIFNLTPCQSGKHVVHLTHFIPSFFLSFPSLSLLFPSIHRNKRLKDNEEKERISG